jgi:hypothetical protein
MVRRRVDLSKVAVGWHAPWSDNTSVLKKYEAFLRTLEE